MQTWLSNAWSQRCSALNKAIAMGLKPGERVVAVSGGNHAQSVAYAARTLGLRATMLDGSPAHGLDIPRPVHWQRTCRGVGRRGCVPLGAVTAASLAHRFMRTKNLVAAALGSLEGVCIVHRRCTWIVVPRRPEHPEFAPQTDACGLAFRCSASGT